MPISLIWRMILSKKSATFWDHSLASQELVATARHFRQGVGNEHNARVDTGKPKDPEKRSRHRAGPEQFEQSAGKQNIRHSTCRTNATCSLWR